MPRAATRSDVFNAVAEHQRRRILTLLRSGPRPVNGLARALGIAQPRVSKHLRVLRDVGLVRVQDEGRQRFYELDAEGLRPIHEWVGGFEQFWSGSFDRLNAYVKALQSMEDRVMSEDVQSTADREVRVSRLIEGRRELVYAAFTEVRHLAHWFGPDGFSTTTRVFDFRPGGVWEFTMHGPDGTDYPNRIDWRVIVPGERIEYTQGARADDPEAFETTVTFESRDGGTMVTLRSVFRTKAQRDRVVERYGAVEGAHQTLGRLAAYIASEEWTP